MSYFIRNSNTFRIAPEESLDIQTQLPVGNYTVKFNEMAGFFFLEMVDPFTPIKKLYGDTQKNSNRILRTYLDRDVSTGVMLTGEKGSGKSLLAKTLSIDAAVMDIPTIIINESWCGDNFNKFLQDIEQPCVILFDEFEKVYDNDSQEKALTLLDGVFPSRKLFVITCNDKWRVNEHMRNRPGRIFYMLDFKGLTPDFIREYCDDTLVNKEHIDKIVEISALFEQFNFDMLKALVEEMNRYDETPQESLKMLNAKPEFNNNGKFEVQLVVDGEPVKENVRTEWNGNPLSGQVYFEWYSKVKYNLPASDTGNSDLAVCSADEDGEFWNEIMFTPNNIVKVDAQEGKFTYQNGNAFCILTRKKESNYNYLAF
jgi:ATPase family associated with various cellular activities (AAA)